MKQSILQQYQTVKKYIIEHNEQAIGIGIVVAILLIILIVALIVKANGPNIVYQPVKACDLFTPSKAQRLLGEKVISVDTKQPEISGNVAVSKCSYTDANPDAEQLLVAAIAVRSAINDEGAIKNKEDFATSRANNEADTVTGIGDDAYYNKKAGQLNVLKDKSWTIISYGRGSAPETNTPEKAVELAKITLD